MKPNSTPSSPFSAKKIPRFYNFILLVGSTLVALVLAEIGLRILSPMPRFGPYFDLRPYKKLQLFPHLPGVASPVWHTSNQWGLRGDDPPSDWDDYDTIITIGGSTTQCFYLDDHQAWPFLLQENLQKRMKKVWVGNAGLDGHSSNGHRLMMQRIIPLLKPKTVVLLVGANDLALSFAEDRQMNDYDHKFKERLNSPGAFLYNHSRLLQVLYVWKRVLFHEVKVVAQAGPPPYVPEKLAQPETLPPDLARLLPSLPDFVQNVTEIADLAKALGIRAVFLTQPCLYEDNPYWSSILAQNFWTQGPKQPISAATQWRMLDLFNRELLRTCREQGMECYDLASALPHSFEYFYDPYHFTDRGAERVAAAVAAYLLDRPAAAP